MPPESETVQVMLLIAGGHQCELSVASNAPLLRELFQALSDRSDKATQKVFEIPMDEGNRCLYFPGQSLVAIATDPPVNLEKMQLQKASSQKEDDRVQQLEWQLEIYRKLEQLSPKYGKIERKSRLSREEFLENYYTQNTPVILTDLMKNWKALSLWTPEYLKQNYGQVKVGVQVDRESNPLYEVERNKHQKIMPFGEFVDRVVSGRQTNDYYMGSYNGNLERKELQGLLEDIEMFPEYLDEQKDPKNFSFWFGPAGTVTPLHFDSLNSFLCQVYGRKQVRLISPNHKHLLYNFGKYHSKIDLAYPDYEKYPRLKDVHIIDIFLEAGEVLFLPVGWWHYVKSLEISISISLMNFIFPNDFE